MPYCYLSRSFRIHNSSTVSFPIQQFDAYHPPCGHIMEATNTYSLSFEKMSDMFTTCSSESS
eukprot:scaffold37989_cov54-Attheya_sp.AAC.2